jgi:predicted RNase H-like HicB family nuclease
MSKEFIVYIEQDEDGIYIGSIPSIPSCYAEGDTQEAMLKNLADVTKLCLRNSGSASIEKTQFVGTANLEITYA